TFWSGLVGGFFLQLSYFGTDQSQVGRYLGGRSVKESRLGLLFNGLVKVPMQFFILFLGAMVFVFYQFTAPPVFFNPVETRKTEKGRNAAAFHAVEEKHEAAFAERRAAAAEIADAVEAHDETRIAAARTRAERAQSHMDDVRKEAVALVKRNPGAD